MLEITLPVAFAIVGSLGTILTFFYRFFKNEEDPKVSELQDEVNQLQTELAVIRSDIQHYGERTQEIKEKLGEFSTKLEKISDLIIELIKTQNS